MWTYIRSYIRDKYIMGGKIRSGTYKHYKGKRYKVIGVAKHSETSDKFVVYKALYGGYDLWVRPLEMFLETVEVDGEDVPRFEYVG